MSTEQIQLTMVKFLRNKGYKKISYNNYYIVAEGALPVTLVAHMDTVQPYSICYTPEMLLYDQQQDIFHAIGGCVLDDRLGISIIIKIIEAGFRPSIIFTNLEEKGGIGASVLIQEYPSCPFSTKFIIELDRRGRNDAVYYSCGNQKFQKYINSFGFNTEYGTFTDCLILGEAWDIAAVNLSCGYELEHTVREYAHLKWTEETENKVKKILRQNLSILPIFTYDNISSLQNKCVICDKEIKKEQDKIFYSQDYYICQECKEKFNILDDRLGIKE